MSAHVTRFFRFLADQISDQSEHIGYYDTIISYRADRAGVDSITALQMYRAKRSALLAVAYEYTLAYSGDALKEHQRLITQAQNDGHAAGVKRAYDLMGGAPATPTLAQASFV